MLGDGLTPGSPTVQQLVHDGVRFTVTVAPARPGWNLVRVDTAGVAGDHGHDREGTPEVRVGSAKTPPVPATPRPGTGGLWARVLLPPGISTVEVSHGPEHRLPFPVSTGAAAATTRSAAGVNGPECAMTAVGAVLAGSGRPVEVCPADRLTVEDADTLRAAVRVLADRGAERVVVVADGTERGRAAEAVVSETAEHEGIATAGGGATPGPTDALVVVAGWRTAARALDGTATEQRRVALFNHGVWLAPWLLTPQLVDAVSGAVLPLRFDIRDDDARSYAAALGRTLPGMSPSQAGYTGWVDARGEAAGEPVRLYAAARTAYMPAPAGHAAHETSVAWFPGGTVTPVSGELESP
ncbi:MAG TPA: hypothetical protein VLA97_06470 [Nocardioidaceae bacterium]|nr:hypothetical protein [Nocardioidaceae bacterium]